MRTCCTPERLEARRLLSTYYVSPLGHDAAAGTSDQAAFATLQHAASLVQAGDTVIVRAGSYAGFQMSWYDPQGGTAFAPIRFLADPGAIITSRNTKTADGIDLEGGSDYVTIQGFTVNNASGTITRAGIRVVQSNHDDILDNVCDHNGEWGIFTGFTDDILIQGNTASNSQTEHGIYVSNSSQRPVIRGNACFGNYSAGIQINGDVSEGGVGVTYGAVIEQNVIHDNGRAGPAINLDGVQSSRIQNNLLYNNHLNGISLFMQDAAQPSRNNIIVNNTIMTPSGAGWAIDIQSGSTGNIVYNNIFYNANPNRGSIDISTNSLPGFFSDYNSTEGRFTPDDSTLLTLAQWQVQTGQDRHSLIATPAMLFVNAAANDYRLAASSPAIAAGTSLLLAPPPINDLAGNPRLPTARWDLGAYRFTAASPILGDVNGDGTVNMFDVLVIIRDFGQTGATYSQGDLNGDGVVNLLDVLILARNYGR